MISSKTLKEYMGKCVIITTRLKEDPVYVGKLVEVNSLRSYLTLKPFYNTGGVPGNHVSIEEYYEYTKDNIKTKLDLSLVALISEPVFCSDKDDEEMQRKLRDKSDGSSLGRFAPFD